jgi:hypothetical protein
MLLVRVVQYSETTLEKHVSYAIVQHAFEEEELPAVEVTFASKQFPPVGKEPTKR